MFSCKFCGKILPNSGSLTLHQRACDKNPDHQMSKTRKMMLDRKYRREHNIKTRKPLSEEHKQKIREGYYRWTTENREKFIKYSSGQSNACEVFKKKLRQANIQFVEELTPYWNERGYRLDIAFPDDKIGIEINGTQHYNSDGSLNAATLEKQKFFEDRGWKIIQVYYKDAIKETPTVFSDLLKMNLSTTEYIKEDIDTRILAKKKKQQELENKRRNRSVKKEEFYNKRKAILYDLIKNSGIDFSHFGWVKLAKQYLAEKNNLYSQHLFEELVKYYPDFIKSENVFKRKGSVLPA